MLIGVGTAHAQTYRQSSEKNCDGYRRLSLSTPQGVCVSLMATNLGFPRGVVALSDSQLLVADMGNWEKNRGRLLRIDLSTDGEPAKVSVLLTRLDRPHGLARGADGRIWLGEATRISEIRFAETSARLFPVMVGAPGNERHPLIGLTVMGDGRLAFSTGSASDACEGGIRNGICRETIGPNARAAIRIFTPRATPLNWRDIPPYATGLRNSAALAFDATAGVLWAGENSMDLPSPTLPPDELNKIVESRNYGWPACFGNGLHAPGVGRSSCRGTQSPARSLPAHSAPLGAVVIEGGLAGAGARAIALTLHGYMPTGHRVILVPLTSAGDIAGPNRELVFGWSQARGVRPMGTPVGITLAPDGALFVTEDGNGNLLRITQTPE